MKWTEQVQDRLKWKDIVEKAKTLSCSAVEEEEEQQHHHQRQQQQQQQQRSSDTLGEDTRQLLNATCGVKSGRGVTLTPHPF